MTARARYRRYQGDNPMRWSAAEWPTTWALVIGSQTGVTWHMFQLHLFEEYV